MQAVLRQLAADAAVAPARVLPSTAAFFIGTGVAGLSFGSGTGLISK